MSNEEIMKQLDEAIDDSFYGVSQLENGSDDKAKEIKMLNDLLSMRKSLETPCDKEEPKEETKMDKILKVLKVVGNVSKDLIVPVLVVTVPVVITSRNKSEVVDKVLSFQRGDEDNGPGVIDGFSERLMNLK